MRRGHSALGQKQRGTVNRRRTRYTRAGSSARRREYRRRRHHVSWPHVGQEVLGFVVAIPRVRVTPSQSARTRRLPTGTRRSWSRSRKSLPRVGNSESIENGDNLSTLLDHQKFGRAVEIDHVL